MKLFTKRREGFLSKPISKNRQQSATNEGQVGEQVGLAGTRTVFAHQHVASPVIADFDSAPMSPDQGQPLLGGVLLWWRTGEIISGLGGGDPGPLLGPVTADDD